MALQSTKNYFQNNGYVERNPPPPGQCCFLQMAKDQASFEHTTTVPPGGGGEGRIGTATMFQKKIMLPKYAIFSTVLFKIVAFHVGFLRVAIIYKNYKFCLTLKSWQFLFRYSIVGAGSILIYAFSKRIVRSPEVCENILFQYIIYTISSRFKILLLILVSPNIQLEVLQTNLHTFT